MIVRDARAKLNLALHVRARRADGFHELETLFAFVADGDQVTLAPAAADSLVIDGPFSDGLSAGPDNLVVRARDAFRSTVAPHPPCALRLTKRLPVASGIGGGSADAAATLGAMAHGAGVPLDAPALVACAAALGSDVPACLLGRTAVGRGRGEALQPIDGAAGMPVLLVNPRVPLSTAAVFARWDGVDRGPLADGTLLDVARAGRNDLEPPARALAPAIGAVLARLRATDASLVRMSGSGATCFAMFDTAAGRAAAAASIRTAAPDWWCLETELA